MNSEKKVLIVGVFRNKKTWNKIPCSAPEQMASVFKNNGIEVITTSRYLNRFSRFFDTVITILFNAGKYDVAIVPWFNGTGSYYWQEIATRLLKLLNKKVILVVRGGGIPDLIDKYPRKYLKTLLRADQVVCPSTFIASRLLQHNIQSPVIENAITLSRYPFIAKEEFSLNMLWMRTIEPLYNPVMAIEVGKLLKEKNIPFTIHIAGQDNGQLKELKQLCDQYQLNGEINFIGFINHQQKLEMVQQCDIYICTNRVDNAPVSLVEMMSFGLPVVSTNVGGIPHFIKDGENGLLVNDNDALAMVDKLLEIHLCPSVGKKLVKNGYLFSRNFDEKKVLDKWIYYINLVTHIPAPYTIKPTVERLVLLSKHEKMAEEKVY